MRLPTPPPVVNRRRSRVLAVTLVALIAMTAGACGSDSSSGSGAPTTTEPVTTSQTSVTATTTTPEPAPSVPEPTAHVAVDWNDPSQAADLGDGWTLAACAGDAPLLCVSRDGDAAGVVESARFPVESFDVFDPAADNVENLHRLAADFIAVLRSDRVAGCPDGYAVDELEPAPFVLAGAEALSYGYVGTNGDGSPSEFGLQYATIDGDDVVLVSAIAYDEGGCPGRDDLSSFDSKSLADVRPRLEAVLPSVPLPPGARR